MKLRPHSNNVLMLNLTAVSGLCLLVLVGGYFYSGSLLPSLQRGASLGERLGVWLVWSVVAAVPLITSVFWMMRFRKKP